jgi:uncharacterized membrane protein YfhO
VGWSPRWSATIDGASVPVTEAPDGLIGLAIEPGEHTIALHYRVGGSAWLGLIISITTVVALAGRDRLARWAQQRRPVRATRTEPVV